MNEKRWKIWSLVILVVAMGTNGWQVMDRVDATVMASHREQTLYEFANQIQALAGVCDEAFSGLSGEEIEASMRKQLPDVYVFSKKDLVVAGYLEIRLHKGVFDSCVVVDSVAHWSELLR